MICQSLPVTKPCQEHCITASGNPLSNLNNQVKFADGMILFGYGFSSRRLVDADFKDTGTYVDRANVRRNCVTAY